MQRVTEGRPILEPQVILDIFSCMRELLGLHEAFFQRLEARMENMEAFRSHTIADIFLLHVILLSTHSSDNTLIHIQQTKFLLLYPLYVNNFDLAAATLKKQKASNPEFAEFVRVREQKSNMKLQDVESLLLMPVQRIPQYTLLLQVIQVVQDSPKSATNMVSRMANFRTC